MAAFVIGGRCDNLLAGWRLAMSSIDKCWLLWLLMMAIFEFELELV